ncbi:MAG TPA: cupredoxin domain-containing protein [Terriglobales bacterium]
MRPFLLLAILGLSIFSSSCNTHKVQSGQAVRIKIVMKKYSIQPQTIRLKRGQPVTLEVSTADVEHGFEVEELKIDEPVQPGKPAIIEFTPQQAGDFRMNCDIICGPMHDSMEGRIIVE